jgi:hypothetical protein
LTKCWSSESILHGLPVIRQTSASHDRVVCNRRSRVASFLAAEIRSKYARQCRRAISSAHSGTRFLLPSRGPWNNQSRRFLASAFRSGKFHRRESDRHESARTDSLVETRATRLNHGPG